MKKLSRHADLLIWLIALALVLWAVHENSKPAPWQPPFETPDPHR